MTSDEPYDLESDPGEMHNLIDSPAKAGIRSRLQDKLLDWMNASRDPFRGYYWGTDLGALSFRRTGPMRA